MAAVRARACARLDLARARALLGGLLDEVLLHRQPLFFNIFFAFFCIVYFSLHVHVRWLVASLTRFCSTGSPRKFGSAGVIMCACCHIVIVSPHCHLVIV